MNGDIRTLLAYSGLANERLSMLVDAPSAAVCPSSLPRVSCRVMRQGRHIGDS